MARLFSDLRYAVRAVFKNPRFSIVAVAALALGIGANAAIFSVVNAVLLQPLPYPDAERLVRLCREVQGQPGCAESIPKYLAWSRAQAFDAIAAYDFAGPGLNLGGGDRPEQIKGIHVSEGYFRVFGAAPEVGRTFSAAGRHARRTAGRGDHAQAVDVTLRERPADGGAPDFPERRRPHGDRHPAGPVPVRAAGRRLHSAAGGSEQHQSGALPVGRRASEAGRDARIRARGNAGARRAVPQGEPEMDGRRGEGRRLPMLDIAVGNVRPTLLILLGAVGLVLLIACANVANLLLARAAGRQREVAIRAAIGASRAQIVRQLLIESLLLAVAGAIAGVIVGVWGARGLLALSPGDLPRAEDLAQASFWTTLLDWRVVAFTLGVSLVTAILFGLAPAPAAVAHRAGPDPEGGRRTRRHEPARGADAQRPRRRRDRAGRDAPGRRDAPHPHVRRRCAK